MAKNTMTEQLAERILDAFGPASYVGSTFEPQGLIDDYVTAKRLDREARLEFDGECPDDHFPVAMYIGDLIELEGINFDETGDGLHMAEASRRMQEFRS